MRITLKAINDELARRGVTERLARASGYFYFEFGEAAGWLDRTVRVATVNALTLERWYSANHCSKVRAFTVGTRTVRSSHPAASPNSK